MVIERRKAVRDEAIPRTEPTKAISTIKGTGAREKYFIETSE